MNKSKNKVIETIADVLPEGLDESVLEKIAELVSTTIKNEVKERLNEITIKVKSFIRGNVEKLKEQAVKELELENETFRNAQLFETVRAMFAIENTAEDELNGLTALATISEEQENRNQTLLNQVNKLLKENVQLKAQIKVSTGKVEKLQETLTTVQSSLKNLKEEKDEVRLSDTAQVISEESFGVKETNNTVTKRNHAVNEWLTEGVLENNKKLSKVK